MPGPWVAGSDNPGFLSTMNWSIGEIFELFTYDTSGERQGKLLIEVSDVEAKSRAGRWVEAQVICIEDDSLAWWFRHGPGKKLEYGISLHVCHGPTERCKEVNARKMNEFHTDVIRHLELEDIKKRRVTWWQNKENKKRFEDWRKEKVESGGGPSQKKKVDDWDDLDFEATDEEIERAGPAIEDAKLDKEKKAELESRLTDLKKKVAEKDATKRKRKATSPTGGIRKKKDKKDPKEKKDKREVRISDDELRSSSSRGDRRRVSKAVWFGKKRSPSPGRKKRSPREREKGKGPAAKAGKDDSSHEASDGKKKDEEKKKKKKRKKLADRGPYGSGRIVRYGEGESESSSDSSSESVFQGGVPEKRAQQLVLLEYSDRKPGRLAARLLQKMEVLLSRSGTPQIFAGDLKDRTPAVATSYLLTMILPLYKERMNVRMMRELRTLAGALDQIAIGCPEKAADLLSQRLKALELMLSDQGWARAQYLELIPMEGAGLAEPEEQRMASKEQALEAKIRQYLPSGWKKEEKPHGEGKGKGKKGKGKKGKEENEDKKREKAPVA